jgi:hypothetical protein
MSYQTRAYDGASLTRRMRAALRNGIGRVMLKDRPSGFWNSALSKGTARPRPTPKKSPMGAWTAGVAAPSQYISSRTSRRCSALRGIVPLIQMRCTRPARAHFDKADAQGIVVRSALTLSLGIGPHRSGNPPLRSQAPHPLRRVERIHDGGCRRVHLDAQALCPERDGVWRDAAVAQHLPPAVGGEGNHEQQGEGPQHGVTVLDATQGTEDPAAFGWRALPSDSRIPRAQPRLTAGQSPAATRGAPDSRLPTPDSRDP